MRVTTAVGARISRCAAMALMSLTLSASVLWGTAAVADAAPYPPIPPTTVSIPVPGAPTPAVATVPAPVLNPAAQQGVGDRAQVPALQPGQFPVQAATGAPAPHQASSMTAWVAMIAAVGSALAASAFVFRFRRSRARS